jgi:hypothetical protein
VSYLDWFKGTVNLAILWEEKEDGRIPRMRAALLHIGNKQARAAA